MSTPIQKKNIVENLEIQDIKDAKALERKDKSAVAKAGIKYVIANFLNEKTGGKFSFLRNWKENSGNHLLEQMNDVFSENIAEQIKKYANNAQNWANKSETIKLMQRFDSTNAFVEIGQKSLQYCSDLLTGPTNNTDPQTVNSLFAITGTLYQENEVLKPVMDQVKNDILQLAFSKGTIENIFDKLNLKFLSKPANRLIVLLGIKDKVDNFFTDKILNNKDFNLNKKELVKAEEILLYKTLSFFANYSGDKWSDEQIKKLFDKTKDPFFKGLLKNYEEIEKLYQNSKLMKILSWTGTKICKTDFLNSILKNIASRKHQNVANKSFLDKLEDACTKANEYLDKLESGKTYFINGYKLCVKKVGESTNAAFEAVKQTPKVVKEVLKTFQDLGECKMFSENQEENIFKKVASGQELQDLLDDCDEQTQNLIKTGEETLKEDIRGSMQLVEAHGKDDKKSVKTKQPELTLSDLQEDFSTKDAEILRDDLNAKASSLNNKHPIEDKGWTWTATYHLAKTFQNMLQGKDLQIEINGQPLDYDENSADIEKEKVLSLNNALNDNPNRVDGTSIVKTLSLLADEETLLDFIPENIKNKLESYGLQLGTYEKTRNITEMQPNIHLSINKGNPMNAEINVSWPLLNESNLSQHTFGLNFTSVLDLNENNGTIETAISSIKDLQYTFDGKNLEAKTKIDEAGLANNH